MTTVHECPYCGKRYDCQREVCNGGLYWACIACKKDAPILYDVPAAMFHQSQERGKA